MPFEILPSSFETTRGIFESFDKTDRCFVFEDGIFKTLENTPFHFLARDSSGKDVGFLFANHWEGDRECLSVTLGVIPDFRRKGVGKALFGELSARTVESGLSRVVWRCAKDNMPSYAFAKKLGGKLRGRDSKYYKFVIEIP